MDLNRYDDLKIIDSAEEMMRKILQEPEEQNNVPMIIAMKGDAYSGKTGCADAIAKYYRCPVISFDGILDSLSGPSGPAVDADRLADLAFDVIVRHVKLQLEFGRPTVVDSPLSNRSHLEKLLRLEEQFKSCSDKACGKLHCHLVIVECRPEIKYAWEQRFEMRDRAATDKWYKPKEWADVKHSPSIADCDPALLSAHVCRLIVDTTGYVNYRHLGPATHDLTWCPTGHLLNLRDWLPTNPIHKKVTFLKSVRGDAAAAAALSCGQEGRHFLHKEVSLNGRCGACQHPISGSTAYACTRCNLSLHKSCANLPDRAAVSDPHSTLPPFLRVFNNVSVSAHEFDSSIPVEYRRIKCGPCQVAGMEFSVDCGWCLWEMHLRSGIVPTVVRHEGHHGGGHPLFFWITPAAVIPPREYQCQACKLPGSRVGYTCLKGEFKYNLHVECALLPRPMRHTHGGHEHDMRLVFGTWEVEEDYICDVCLEPRNDPTAWYYYCDFCKIASHLHCIYRDDI